MIVLCTRQLKSSALGFAIFILSACGMQKADDTKIASYLQAVDCHFADFRALAPDLQTRCVSCHGSSGSGRLVLLPGGDDGVLGRNLAALRPFLESVSGTADESLFMERVSSSGTLSHSLKLGNSDPFMLSFDLFIQDRIDDPSCTATDTGGGGGGGFF